MNSIRVFHKRLGCGARGVVYEGYDEETGCLVAVKEIPYHSQPIPFGQDPVADPSSGSSGASPSTRRSDSMQSNRENAEACAILREIQVMQRSQHPNLVRYFGAKRSANGIQLIMERVGGGSLEKLLKRCGKLKENIVRKYTHDILLGLQYLHTEVNVCHRDIKPGNILLTTDGRCKLTDFGVSKILCGSDVVDKFMTTTVGTPWYMAPEVIGGENMDDSVTYSDPQNNSSADPLRTEESGYNTSADIWSLGVTVFEMISGRRPFGNDSPHPTAVLFAILSSEDHPPELPDDCEASLQLRQFLALCFIRDKMKRPSAKQLLSHWWFAPLSNSHKDLLDRPEEAVYSSMRRDSSYHSDLRMSSFSTEGNRPLSHLAEANFKHTKNKDNNGANIYSHLLDADLGSNAYRNHVLDVADIPEATHYRYALGGHHSANPCREQEAGSSLSNGDDDDQSKRISNIGANSHQTASRKQSSRFSAAIPSSGNRLQGNRNLNATPIRGIWSSDGHFVDLSEH